jgi:hypothetical protein
MSREAAHLAKVIRYLGPQPALSHADICGSSLIPFPAAITVRSPYRVTFHRHERLRTALESL